MKSIIFVFLVCVTFSVPAQEQKKKTKTDAYQTEIYFVNKKDKKKNGPSVLVTTYTKDTLAKGEYLNDSKSGTWTYYANSNKVFMRYDYSSGKLEYFAGETNPKDSFYIKANDTYVLAQVDSPPIFIGYDNEVKNLVARKIVCPLEVVINRLTGFALVTLEIGEDGRPGYVFLEKKFQNTMDAQLIKIIESIKGQWVPAMVNGKPVGSKIYFVLSVSPLDLKKGNDPIKEKPYILKVDLSYSSPTRTTTTVMPGSNPNRSRSGTGGFR